MFCFSCNNTFCINNSYSYSNTYSYHMLFSLFTCSVLILSKLKVTPPKQGYRPDVTSPALIKNLLKTGLPKIHLPKVDISKELTFITTTHYMGV